MKPGIGPNWLIRRKPPPSIRLIDRLAAPLDDLLDLLLEQDNASLLVIDRKGRMIRASAALRRMAGRGTEATLGGPAIELFAAEERNAVWSRLRPALLGRPPEGSIVATLEHAGGEPGRAVEITLLTLREADGGISGLLLRLADMTVQKRLEAQLAQSQKLQAVGQLAAGIAHDFNNLLTAILGGADMIAARPEMDAETREDAAQIRGSAERGGGLVRQLLAFGRQQALLPQVISINDAIRGVSGLLGRLLGSKILLELDLETPGRMARVDPTQLDQVLINLAVNASDAMAGVGTLTLRSGHITLHRPLVRGQETIPPGRYVMIEVKDTGSGIPPDVLPRIFDPFFTTKRDRGGTGLGLSTVHGIVRQSDGFLGIESELGRGTSLRVYLPRLDPDDAAVSIPYVPSPPLQGTAWPASPAPPVSHTPPIAAPPIAAPIPSADIGGGRLVLLVEDEAPVRALAHRSLERDGWRVLASESAEAALVAVSQQAACQPSLLISDVMMPGMDGPSLVARLRLTWPDLPAILVSGYADERLRDQLARSGVMFVAKPYRLRDLIVQSRLHAAPLDR